MNLNIFDFTYLITAIFGTYIIYKFMSIFFDRRKMNKNVEFFSYLIYFIITSSIYFIINIPMVNLITNIILFLLLTFNYEASMKSRFFSVIFMYVILISVDGIVALILVHFFHLNLSESSGYTLTIGMISEKLISYIIVLLIDKYNDMKKGVNIPNTYWISIFFIPLGSLYIIINLLLKSSFTASNIVISIVILFIINIFVFYLYDALTKFFEEKIEKTMLKEQNKYYKKQLEIMNTTNENTRAFNHDLANHLAIVRGYIQIDESDRACKYIDKMTKNVYTVKEFSNSGNIDIDSILNHKLYEASKKEIAISLEVKVPISINIASFDIVVILGNLLDNAIEATSKVKDNKCIDIIIIYKEEILFINIKNTFTGSVYYEKDKIKTSKKDIENHGIGLNNIENILKRYDGVMDIDHDHNEFQVEITMYID